MSSDTEADWEDVKEEAVKNAIFGTELALMKKMISSTKVRSKKGSVKLTGREQLGARKATSAWTITNFGHSQKKTKEDASYAVWKEAKKNHIDQTIVKGQEEDVRLKTFSQEWIHFSFRSCRSDQMETHQE